MVHGQSILKGLSVTLGLTVVAMIIGTAIGLVWPSPACPTTRLFGSLAGLFIWFFRGTPLLVQLIFWYNLSTLFPEIQSRSRSAQRWSVGTRTTSSRR